MHRTPAKAMALTGLGLCEILGIALMIVVWRQVIRDEEKNIE